MLECPFLIQHLFFVLFDFTIDFHTLVNVVPNLNIQSVPIHRVVALFLPAFKLLVFPIQLSLQPLEIHSWVSFPVVFLLLHKRPLLLLQQIHSDLELFPIPFEPLVLVDEVPGDELVLFTGVHSCLF